jgi:hypothetical protein
MVRSGAETVIKIDRASDDWNRRSNSPGQEALAAVLPELLDPAGRVHALGHNTASAGKNVRWPPTRGLPVGRHRQAEIILSLGRTEPRAGLYSEARPTVANRFSTR